MTDSPPPLQPAHPLPHRSTWPILSRSHPSFYSHESLMQCEDTSACWLITKQPSRHFWNILIHLCWCALTGQKNRLDRWWPLDRQPAPSHPRACPTSLPWPPTHSGGHRQPPPPWRGRCRHVHQVSSSRARPSVALKDLRYLLNPGSVAASLSTSCQPIHKSEWMEEGEIMEEIQ